MSQLPDISAILLRGTTEADPQKRGEAENQINSMIESNFPLALCTLTNEILQESKDPNSRRVAGTVFKNALYSKNNAEREMKEAAWLEIDPGMRNEMKNSILQTLHSPVSHAANSAALVVSRIAQIELPEQQWGDLIVNLLRNMSEPNSAPQLKVFTLKTLGFICEDIPPNALDEQAKNKVLTAIISGMRRDTQNVDIILAACDAFFNCLKFIEKNFEVPNERSVIMDTLIDTAGIACPTIQVSATMCLVEIASLYYRHLSSHMSEIYTLTMNAIQGDDQQVACQAIEFWSTICDEECEIYDDPEVYLKLIEKVLQYLLPPLLESYQKRDYDDDDDDSLNVAIAASRCVANISLVVRDRIVEFVLPTIQRNINQAEWEKKDSATLLFADILDGPSDEKMLKLIKDILPILFEQLKNPSVHLKDTTCWTIARICQLYRPFVRENVPTFLQALHPHFGAEPQITNHCCFAVHSIAEAFEDYAEEETSPMSSFFLFLIEEMLKVAYRTDGHEIGLRAIAFEAIAVVIQYGAKDTNETLLKTVPHFQEKLTETFTMQIVSNDDKEGQIELQGYLCTLLTHITQKVGRQIYQYQFHVRMLELFLSIFKFHANGSRASIHEDVMMALGAVVNAIDSEFQNFLPAFMPYILQAMKSTQESSLIKNCVGLITDLAGALKKDLFHYCSDIIEPLFLALKDDNLDRNVKPLIISCFGDIANAIGANFQGFLRVVCQVLVAASGTPRGDIDDEGYQEFLGNLRVSIFDAYTGIIQGLRQDDQGELFLPYANYMMGFIDTLVGERAQFPEDDLHRRDSVLSVMIGAIGDFAELGGNDVTALVNRPTVFAALREATEHNDPKIQKLGEWARRVVTELVPRT